MQRRNFLIWVSRALETGLAALVAIPGVQYVWSTLRPETSVSNTRRRIVRWKDLRPGAPMQFSIYGERRDAWHVEPQQVIGRVWLVRQPGSETPEAKGVTAFTSLCPHMGCQVQRSGAEAGFVCPCHRATFGLDGQPQQQGGERNHAPRGLDELPCELVCDAAGDVWVEVEYQRFEPSLTQKVAKA
ncbi:MAG: petC 1 [Planctomycetaceae bacterium]|nr:petC 1 [Planctomycetaceae bacterium]